MKVLIEKLDNAMSEPIRVVVERIIPKYLLQFDGEEINISEVACLIIKLQSIIDNNT
jgi:hypothetical protein